MERKQKTPSSEVSGKVRLLPYYDKAKADGDMRSKKDWVLANETFWVEP